MQVFTSMIVLGLAIAAFVIIDVKGFKNRKLKSSTTIAQVIGSNSISTLEFLDHDAAKKILSDLTSESDILNANLLDKNGSVFASYTREGSDTTFRFSIPSQYEKNFLFTDQYLFVYHKIKKNNETLGMVCIRFELSQLNKIKINIYLLGLVLLLIGIGFAFLIASIIQRYISKPVLNLVTVMQKVKDSADYKVRVKLEGDDEISKLSLGFNNMLSTIEKRGQELELSKQELDQKNTLLNSVIQNMGDGLVVTDKNGKFILWNTTGEKMLGIGYPDIPKEKWVETYGFFLPDTQTPYSTPDLPLVKALNGEEVDNIEMFVRNPKKPKGLFITVTSRPLKDPSGAIIGGVAVFHDTTERKNAENEIKKLNADLEQKIIDRTARLATANENLSKSEEKYRKIVEEVGDVVYTTDYKGYFTYINPACEKLTGYTQKEFIGKHFSELIAPDWKARVVEFYLNQFKNRIAETIFSFPILTKSGEQKWIEQTVLQVREGDRITEQKCIVRDITARKAAEDLLKQKSEELKKTIEQLDLSVKEMESFSYSVSHDLRSPVRGITSFANLLKKDYNDKFDEKGKDLLNIITSEAVRMGQLIDDLLAFSRLGKKEIQKSTVDMNVLAKEVVDEVLKLAEVKYNAKITIKDLPSANCDAALIRQVFVNLISNALKFSNLKPEPMIEIGSKSENDETVYYIKDNGAGFDMKFYDKLFGVFQRLHSAEDFKGTGIGLAIAKRIITSHGGRIWAEGKVNEGATFYFSLPKLSGVAQ